jgi:hypothetical protein
MLVCAYMRMRRVYVVEAAAAFGILRQHLQCVFTPRRAQPTQPISRVQVLIGSVRQGCLCLHGEALLCGVVMDLG